MPRTLLGMTTETLPARRGRIRFPDISSRAYEHPADRGALVALRAIPGFDSVLKTLSGAIGERSIRWLYLATAIRVSPAPVSAHPRDAERVCDDAGRASCS